MILEQLQHGDPAQQLRAARATIEAARKFASGGVQELAATLSGLADFTAQG